MLNHTKDLEASMQVTQRYLLASATGYGKTIILRTPSSCFISYPRDILPPKRCVDPSHGRRLVEPWSPLHSPLGIDHPCGEQRKSLHKCAVISYTNPMGDECTDTSTRYGIRFPRKTQIRAGKIKNPLLTRYPTHHACRIIPSVLNQSLVFLHSWVKDFSRTGILCKRRTDRLRIIMSRHLP